MCLFIKLSNCLVLRLHTKCLIKCQCCDVSPFSCVLTWDFGRVMLVLASVELTEWFGTSKSRADIFFGVDECTPTHVLAQHGLAKRLCRRLAPAGPLHRLAQRPWGRVCAFMQGTQCTSFCYIFFLFFSDEANGFYVFSQPKPLLYPFFPLFLSFSWLPLGGEENLGGSSPSWYIEAIVHHSFF